MAIEPHDSITAQLIWMACADLKEAANDMPEMIERCTAMRQSEQVEKVMRSKDPKGEKKRLAILSADKYVEALRELYPAMDHLSAELAHLTADSLWINRLNIVIYQVFYKLHHQPVNEDYDPYYAVVNYSVNPPRIIICEKCDDDFDQYTYLIGVINNLGSIYTEMIDVRYNYYNMMLEAVDGNQIDYVRAEIPPLVE